MDVVLDASHDVLLPTSRGQISKAKLLRRFQSFVEGHWIRLIEASEQFDEKAVSRRWSRHRVPDHDDLEKRVAISQRIRILALFRKLTQICFHYGTTHCVDKLCIHWRKNQAKAANTEAQVVISQKNQHCTLQQHTALNSDCWIQGNTGILSTQAP